MSEYDDLTGPEDDIGFVVCAFCGTRIRADRRKCLRCGELLREKGTPEPPWVPIQLSRAQAVVLGAVAASIAVLLMVAVWRTRPERVDDVARPLPGAPPAKARAAAPAPAPAVGVALGDPLSAAPFEPTAFLDGPSNTAAALPTGDVAATREELDAALAVHPNDPETLNGLGQALVAFGSAGEAIPYFERAVALAPGQWAYHFNLARAVGQVSQWDRAADEYLESARLFEGQASTHFNLALSLHRNGDDEGAIPQFQNAILLNAAEPRFHVSLAISLEQVGRTADAVREYQKYLELAPAAPDADQLRAHIQVLSSARP